MILKYIHYFGYFLLFTGLQANACPEMFDTNSPIENKDILVVEDTPHIHRALKDFLSKKGYNIKVAENGQEALEILQSFNPHTIITDLDMPIMNGIEFIENIKKSSTPFEGKIIVSSGNRSRETLLKAIELGADYFVEKLPFSGAELAEAYTISLLEKITYNEKENELDESSTQEPQSKTDESSTQEPQSKLDESSANESQTKSENTLRNENRFNTESKRENKDILVVEDTPYMHRALKDFLSKKGYNVRVAENGQEAIEILQSFNPHTIITDLDMPIMDGMEFIENIKKSSTPFEGKIIVSSGNRSLETQLEAIELGADYFVEKQPFSGAELAEEYTTSLLEKITYNEKENELDESSINEPQTKPDESSTQEPQSKLDESSANESQTKLDESSANESQTKLDGLQEAKDKKSKLQSWIEFFFPKS